MKRFFLLLLILHSIWTYSQEGIDWQIPENGIPVFQSTMKVKSGAHQYSYAFNSGDKIIVKMATQNGKKLSDIVCKPFNSEKIIWKQVNFTKFDEQFEIPQEGVYTFEFKARPMGARITEVAIYRIPSDQTPYNIAWMKFNHYHPEQINYSIDSMIGYKKPITMIDTFKVFDQYLYQSISLRSEDQQVKGQGGNHNSTAQHYGLSLEGFKPPKGTKLKGYNYSLYSVLGGEKHLKIVNTAMSYASFLGPSAIFAKGAVALLGPDTGNEPIQYFMTPYSGDLNIARQLFSVENETKKQANKVAREANKISPVKIKYARVYSENDLTFDQKGRVTNINVFSHHPPYAKYMLCGNNEVGQAKNTYFRSSAIVYNPVYKKINAERLQYNLDIKKVSKSATQYTKTETYKTINF